MKKGSQQRTKAPMMMPSVRAALCSRRIFCRCLSLVGVDCVSGSTLSPMSKALRSPPLDRFSCGSDTVSNDGPRLICRSVTSDEHICGIDDFPLACSLIIQNIRKWENMKWNLFAWRIGLNWKFFRNKFSYKERRNFFTVFFYKA